MSFKIYIGTDHAGFELKEVLVEYLKKEGHEVIDKGAYQYMQEDDYPDYVALVARSVSEDRGETKGIILGGSGQGEAIVANRFSNVRAVVWYGGLIDIVSLSREHNDANILSIGARFVHEEEAKKAVKLWLETSFSEDERHKRRIANIEEVTKK